MGGAACQHVPAMESPKRALLESRALEAGGRRSPCGPVRCPVRCPGSGASSLGLRISGCRISWGETLVQQRCAAAGRHTQAALQARACQAPQVPVRASAASLRTRPLPCPSETFCACQRTTQQLAHTPFEVAVHACAQKGSERAGRSRCWHLPLRKFALDPHPPCPTRTTFKRRHKNPQNHHQSRHWRRSFALLLS